MIGVFGGTFDPVHYGHIKPALSIKQQLNLSALRFIPNRIPPHRDTPWLSSSQRLLLLEAALADYSDVYVDQRELKREGPSYMVDTLQSLRDDFPDESLCLIIGMDAFLGLNRWYKWQSLFDFCHLIVTTRPGYPQSEWMTKMDKESMQFLSERIVEKSVELASPETGKILLQSVVQLDISSTEIREMGLNQSLVRQWMPEAAYQQLREMKL